MTANKWLLSLMVPAALAVSLGACNQPGGATQPGYVTTSAAGSYPGSSSGDPGRVIEMHQDFQRLMERQYRHTIETITGRKVVAFLSQAHLEPDITLEIFFLDRPMNGAAALDLNLPET